MLKRRTYSDNVGTHAGQSIAASGFGSLKVPSGSTAASCYRVLWGWGVEAARNLLRFLDFYTVGFSSIFVPIPIC